MQFLAQIDLADTSSGGEELLSIFMCQNDPGLREEWDATAGGNRAFVFGADAVHVVAAPEDSVSVLDETSAVRFEQLDLWHHQTGRPQREVLGQLAARPAWLQNEETPACGDCAQSMIFVVQLEEGHDDRTAMNCGGGCGYGFRCERCGTAAFLWQS